MNDRSMNDRIPPDARPIDDRPSPRPVTALDRDSPLPLYAQVARRLKAMIAAGEHPANRFHSDGELCAMFAVSRATVLQAVQALSAEGWLRRQQGQGTFVNRQKFDESFSPLMNFLDQWAREGRPLSLAIRRFEFAPCPAEFASWLGMRPDADVLCLERVRVDSGAAVSYDYRYVHPDCAGSIERQEAETTSLLQLLNRRLRLVRGENKVEAALAGESGAALLGVRPADPILIRDMAYFSDDGLPVMVGRSLYRADKVRCAFTVSLSAPIGDSAGIPHPSADNPGGIADVVAIDDWPRRPTVDAP